MKNISIWKSNKKLKKYPKLKENKSVDVLIIGGGITGISTLYDLKETKLDVMLVEQNKIAFSTTGNSTGKLSYLQNDLLEKIYDKVGEKKFSLYLKSQREGIKKITDLIKKENINCDLEKVSSKLYTEFDYEINEIKKIEKLLEKNNIPVIKSDSSLVKSKYMIEVEDTYTLNPIKFIYGLLDSISFPIYEDTSIKRIKKEDNYYICSTDKYKIKAKYVVLATHYPYFLLPLMFPLKSSIEKSYISASKYKTEKISLISYSNPFISIRNYKNYLIYLSNSHLVNNSLSIIENYKELMKKLHDLKLEPEYLWSNEDIITNDGLPYIGRIRENLLIGTGYNTWGLVNGFLAGEIISDIILNKENEYEKLFFPKRFSISNISFGLSSIYNNISGFVKGIFNIKNEIYYKTVNNKDIMVYKDKKTNKKYSVLKKCPHMGCSLVFNEVEKTWDCPCHGSRFDLKGKCIVSPANDDITVDNNEKI